MRPILITLAFALPLAAGPVTLQWDATSPNAAQIDGYLRGKNSPLEGTGPTLETLARQFEIDPRLVVAISGAETTFGKHVCADNNAWNWFHRGPCPASTFVSYGEGLEHVTKFLRRSYLNKGYTTVPLIQAKYCASGCEDWISLVNHFQLEMPAAAAAPAPARLPPAPVPTGAATGSARAIPRIGGVPVSILYICGAIAAIGLVLRLMKRT